MQDMLMHDFSKSDKSRPHYCYDNASLVRCLPVFEEENSLPRSQLHLGICNWNYLA